MASILSRPQCVKITSRQWVKRPVIISAICLTNEYLKYYKVWHGLIHSPCRRRQSPAIRQSCLPVFMASKWIRNIWPIFASLRKWRAVFLDTDVRVCVRACVYTLLAIYWIFFAWKLILVFGLRYKSSDHGLIPIPLWDHGWGWEEWVSIQ